MLDSKCTLMFESGLIEPLTDQELLEINGGTDWLLLGIGTIVSSAGVASGNIYWALAGGVMIYKAVSGSGDETIYDGGDLPEVVVTPQ